MEEIFGRFSGLGKTILKQLDDKNLMMQQIKKQVGHANWSRDWKMLMFKPSSDTEIDIAVAVSQFFKSKQIRMHNKWSPLHIRV